MALPLSSSPSNFPGGFNNVTIRGVPITQSHPGQVYWVGNGGGAVATYKSINNILPRQVGASDGNPGTFNAPFATLQFALNTAQPGRGDIIFIKPSHAETLSSATALTLSTSGVAIVGLGQGSLRPTFTLDTATTTTIGVAGDNISIVNCLFVANFANIAVLFTQKYASMTAAIAGNILTVSVATTGTLYPGSGIYGTGIIPNTYIDAQLSGTTGGVGTYMLTNFQTFASGTITSYCRGFALDKVETKDTSNVLNFLNIVTGPAVANGNDDLYIANSKFTLLTAAGVANLYIASTAGTTNGMRIEDNVYSVVTTNAGAVLVLGAIAQTTFSLRSNTFNLVNAAGTGTGIIATCSTTIQGVMKDNICKCLATTVLPITTATGIQTVNNLYQHAADASGFVLPAIGVA